MAHEAFKKIFSNIENIDKLRNILEIHKSPFLAHLYMHYYKLATNREFGTALQLEMIRFHISSDYIRTNYTSNSSFEFVESSKIAVLRSPRIYELLKKPASNLNETDILDLLVEGAMDVFQDYLQSRLNKYSPDLGYEKIDMLYVDGMVRQDIEFGSVSRKHQSFLLSQMTHVEKLEKYLQHCSCQKFSLGC